ncbi:MAG: GNAT family N-acetyltransferase, partial [Longimicrobiales bacterium]
MDRTSATQPANAAAPALDPEAALMIRPLKTHADFSACVALQRATWGEAYNDCVPASILKITQRVGGVAAGAFSAEGELLGFVYGLTGVEHGHLIHWSHMLAVHPEYRNHGIGRRLKEYQRDVLVRLGVE